MKKSLSVLLIFLIMEAVGSLVCAQELQILTEENPPFSLTGPDKRPTGYGVEIVSEIQKRVKNQDVIRIYPWARAFFTILNKPGVVVFAMSRTQERDPLFQWVGPIIENDWIFVAKKSSHLKISSLDEAKKLPYIGVVRDFAWSKYLKSKGFTNLDAATDYVSNIKKVAVNRIPVFVSSNLSYQYELTELAEKVDDYEVLMEFCQVQMYIAFSKESDKRTVDAWQKAFDDMKKDGTVERLLKKWVPAAKMPEGAKPLSF